MNNLYKIKSINAIFPMILSFSTDDESETITLNVDVDYFNNKVYFGESVSKYPNIDFVKLEEQLIGELSPPEIEVPEISEEILERARQIRSEDYTDNLMKKVNGEEHDSRQS